MKREPMCGRQVVNRVVFLSLIALSPLFGSGCGGRLDDSAELKEVSSSVHVSNDGWGPDTHGLQSRLQLVTGSPKLGAPIVLRLEMKNVGDRELSYDDQQTGINESIELVGPDGRSVLYVDPLYQSMGRAESIEPGDVDSIFEELDLADQYLVVTPGLYRATYRGQGGTRERPGIPRSNTIEFEVAAGPLTADRVVLASLAPVAPKGWHIQEYNWNREVSPPGRDKAEGTTITFHSPAGLKRDVQSVSVHLADRECPSSGTPEPCLYLGRFQACHVYVSASKGVAKAWPDYERAIRERLR